MHGLCHGRLRQPGRRVHFACLHSLQGGQLRRESPVFARLATQLPWSSSVRLVAFWSSSDLLVLPADSAAVEGAENIEMVGYTHLSYLIAPKCWQRVWEALLSEPTESGAP
jgi:hypothetical protein